MQNLIYLLVLAAAGFAVSRIALNFLQTGNRRVVYTFLKDPWLYMFLAMAAGTFGLYTFTPDFKDSLAVPGFWQILLPFVSAALIYVAFLLEIKKLYCLTIIAAAGLTAFWVPETELAFGGLLPWWADRTAAAAVLALVSAGAIILNGMAGIFGIFFITLSAGTALLSQIGGLPLVLGFIGAFWAGIWLGYLNLNWYPDSIYLNNGACASAAFLGAWLLIRGALELAGPSVLILAAYFVAELLWVFVRRYVFNLNYPDIWNYTSYTAVYEKGVSVPAIDTAIAKIGLVNTILAAFQLYSPNGFSIPFFALLIDLWLMNLLYHAGEQAQTFGDANKALVKNVKEGIEEIRRSFGKRKD